MLPPKDCLLSSVQSVGSNVSLKPSLILNRNKIWGRNVLPRKGCESLREEMESARKSVQEEKSISISGLFLAIDPELLIKLRGLRLLSQQISSKCVSNDYSGIITIICWFPFLIHCPDVKPIKSINAQCFCKRNDKVLFNLCLVCVIQECRHWEPGWDSKL